MNAAATMKHWADAVSDGGSNGVTLGAVRYTWDVNPREQKNGALIGRVYLWERGENPRDVGAYKINGDGSVDTIPVEALRGILVAAPAPILTQFDSAFRWEDEEERFAESHGEMKRAEAIDEFNRAEVAQ